MIEPEIAFADLFEVMANAEAYVKFVVKAAREQCPGDFEFFGTLIDKDLPARLDVLVNEPFARLPYTEAVALLQAEIAKDPSKWEFPVVEFGTDFASEHERWLTERHFSRPVFVYNYPREIKSFYMRDNDDGERACPRLSLPRPPATASLLPPIARSARTGVRPERLRDSL
jgi:asparaginyl-tRNA synthetase